MAQQIQRLVVANIAAHIKRPAVSTDRLLNVTADRANISPVKGRSAGWKEGLGGRRHLAPGQLRREVLAHHRGRARRRPGRSGRSSGCRCPAASAEPSPGSPRPSGAAARSPARRSPTQGRGVGGKFVPFGKKTRKQILGGGKVVTVKHEIEPQHAYLAAWRDYDGGARVRRNLDSFLRAISTGKSEPLTPVDGPSTFRFPSHAPKS
jgi:hypothetical protein